MTRDKLREKSDQELLQIMRSEDKDAAEVLMERYKSLVLKKAKAMFLIGGDSDDLIQEGMIGLYSAIRDFDEERGSSFRSFAELCISRQMYTAIESSIRQKHIPLNSYISLYASLPEDSEEHITLLEVLAPVAGSAEQISPEDIVISEDEARRIDQAIAEELSCMEREVWNLHLLGHSYTQIATMLDRTPKSIDNALQRIRAKVKKIVQGL